MRDIVQTERLRRAQTLLTLQLCALVGDLTSLLLCLHDVERVTSRRRTIQSEDDSGLSRTSLLDALVTLIEHSLDTTVARTSHHDVTYLQRTVGYQDGRDIATTLVE